MISLPVSLAIEYDEEASLVQVAAYVAETRQVVDVLRLRPEHNNVATAVRLILDSDYRHDHDYELEEAWT